MGKVLVHDEDEASMWITCYGLPDGWVVETDIVPFAEVLMGDGAWAFALGHVGRMRGHNVD
jgi:hypothetical protein